MKALNLYAVNDLRYDDVALPTIQEDEVLVRVRASGICGSDVQRVYEKGTYHFPTIIGHEFAGEIVQANHNDAELIGKKVAIFPLKPCFQCPSCDMGEYAQCENYDYYGSRCDGGMSEYVAIKKFNLVFMDDALSYEEGAMVEPCAVARHSINQVGVNKGETVVIFGAGTIGLMLATWARLYEAKKIIMTDVDNEKVAFARKMGFDAINSIEIDPVTYIKEQGGADVCVEGAGVSITLAQALQSAKPFGRIVCMGNPLKEMLLPQKAYWEILRKQLTLKGTWNSSYNVTVNDWKESLQAMADNKMDVKTLITHRFPLSESKEAFEILRDRNEFANKVMFIVEGE